MSLESDLAIEGLPIRDISRYAALGMFANPFEAALGADEPGVMCETVSQGNLLLKAIHSKLGEETPKPIWVEKADLPSSYALNAIAAAEGTLARDDAFNALYSYVQLFVMKIGPVRATLGILAERLSFRDFEQTLIDYVETVLAEPDEGLASYSILGPERLAGFASSFGNDAREAVRGVFGTPEAERRPELAELGDLRKGALEGDGEESDSTVEVDETTADAPGTDVLLAEAAEEMGDEGLELLDYFVEYTREHLSPVIARGLRVYRDRGAVALSDELCITKAPRKTLASIIRFAQFRYRKCVFIFDAFENWLDISTDIRSDLVGSLTDLRWKMAGGAFPVFIAKQGEAPELEETFGGATRVQWEFSGLTRLQEQPDVIFEDVVDAWVDAASLEGETPMSMAHPVLASIAQEADGSLAALCRGAYAAIEDAANRGAAELDDTALAAGVSAIRA